MTKGKRAAFRNDEELKMLLQAAWERLEKRAASGIQKGGEKNNVKLFFLSNPSPKRPAVLED